MSVAESAAMLAALHALPMRPTPYRNIPEGGLWWNGGQHAIYRTIKNDGNRAQYRCECSLDKAIASGFTSAEGGLHDYELRSLTESEFLMIAAAFPGSVNP